MALSKRIHEILEQKKDRVIPLFEEVGKIKEFVADNGEESKLPISVDMCVLSIEEFKRGWRCTLIDKEAHGKDFALIKSDLQDLSFREMGEFIFRLSIWRGRKRPTRTPNVKPGLLLHVKEVNDLSLYNNVCQGTTDADTLIKQEGEKLRRKSYDGFAVDNSDNATENLRESNTKSQIPASKKEDVVEPPPKRKRTTISSA